MFRFALPLVPFLLGRIGRCWLDAGDGLGGVDKTGTFSNKNSFTVEAIVKATSKGKCKAFIRARAAAGNCR